MLKNIALSLLFIGFAQSMIYPMHYIDQDDKQIQSDATDQNSPQMITLLGTDTFNALQINRNVLRHSEYLEKQFKTLAPDQTTLTVHNVSHEVLGHIVDYLNLIEQHQNSPEDIHGVLTDTLYALDDGMLLLVCSAAVQLNIQHLQDIFLPTTHISNDEQQIQQEVAEISHNIDSLIEHTSDTMTSEIVLLKQPVITATAPNANQNIANNQVNIKANKRKRYNTLDSKNILERVISCTWPGCIRTFKRRTPFNRHMMLHTGEFPYHCKNCNRGFLDQTKLNTHARFHIGEREYTCNQCNRIFKHKKLLNMHLKKH